MENPVNRLDVLRALHGFENITMQQFNKRYGLNFITLSDEDFNKWVEKHRDSVRWCPECERIEER